MPTLVGLAYSPWTQKARWALTHHGVPHDFESYVPTLGEPKLRLRLRRPVGKVSVPVWFGDDGGVLDDSWDIARHAEQVGSGSALFEDEAAVARWNALSDEALGAGRAKAVRATLEDRDAQVDALKGIVPDPLRRPLRPVAVVAAKQLLRKYGAPPRSALEDALEKLREGLGDGEHLVGGRFGYADMAMAVVLEFVAPGAHVRRSETERRVWGDARLAKRFADLVAWRDRLIAAHPVRPG
ncbi:MAG TPA: glutathione S-transferase [Polyangiaceae bacterium LLY-WYZ-15_(1-7)]|nr:hypothetical protein [Myxococcales bacterium]MAT29233.1 hypothetical protein [Sandaracinus sp.]HJK94276.1 glutathione S-transferase [Polyangiaceae bacterium LLY-WYZ-15_(1-7)]HJL04983.1 glutathione S-transferase [Polyangiaceae bacterium LLY-WYZ-15_(1-7)]HJL11498.1 glutathione S-transferase [Polyangiaceae bacterium LLY-WYZ-15_(1-7)]